MVQDKGTRDFGDEARGRGAPRVVQDKRTRDLDAKRMRAPRVGQDKGTRDFETS